MGLPIIPPPVLIRRDSGQPNRVPLQFPPEQGVTHNVGADWAEGSTLGRDTPIQQWAKGQQETLTLEARFFGRHQFENIQRSVDALRKAVKSDPKLGRPPLWDFIWGSIVHETVVIASVGNLVYRSARWDGSLQDATVQLTLRKYVKFEIAKSDPDEREHNTFYVRAKRGDTYEAIAAARYGDPQIGELLRRQAPDKPFLSPDDEVMVLDEEKVRGVVINPVSIPLQRTAAGIAFRRDLFAARSGRIAQSTVIKR